ncbi:unnamed protein product [Aureobasidium uvarum]|uniref:Fungal N-terminal domain-containing protein n=1 Tax=Aureobasidium uvarum TaxID=2773716 RepID=A0A9N8KGG5_9PEZI|nr:unnamed protein product [Aureobasidium uvarum]
MQLQIHSLVFSHEAETTQNISSPNSRIPRTYSELILNRYASMADPFTIAVSVGGLTSLGIQLLQGLNQYVGSAIDSKGRIKAISIDIDLTVEVFKSLETTIQDDTNRAMMNDTAERLIREAIIQCQDIFTKIQSTLPDLNATGLRKRDFVAWPFVEPKLELLRGNLEKVKTTLQLLMHVIILAAMSKRSFILLSKLFLANLLINISQTCPTNFHRPTTISD